MMRSVSFQTVPVERLTPVLTEPRPLASSGLAQHTPTAQLQLVAQSGLLLHEERPRLVAATALILSSLVLAFAVWAALTKVSEIARAPGEVVPSGYAQAVQQADGGTVKEIAVQEQALVDKGQVLMRLSNPVLERDRDETAAMLAALRRRAATLAAFRDPNSNARALGDPAALLTLRMSRSSERAVLQEQLAQKTAEIAALEADIASYQAQARVSQSELNGLTALKAKGLVTVTRLHEAELRALEADGASRRTQAQLTAARRVVGEYRGRLVALEAKYDDQVTQELSELDGKIAQAQSRLNGLDVQVGQLTVRAPVHGYVKGLQLNTIGAVVTPGQTLFEIVPAGEALAADLHVSARDIGFVHTGQAVRLKVSAFDFARFGVFTGHITGLSAASFTETGAGGGGQKYYKARVTLDPPGVVDEANAQNPRLADLIPGMTLEGDVVLGRQSVLSYLLKPIHIAATSALSER